MLTPEQRAWRRNKLTASDVRCLIEGDKQKIHNLWREKTGDQTYIPEDISKIWSVYWGGETETPHLNWIERRYGPIKKRGEQIAKDLWMGSTLDGWLMDHGCPVEAKLVGGYEKFDEIVNRYYPQCTWICLVTNTPRCLLSVIEGAREPRQEWIDLDPDYGAELVKRGRRFWDCVEAKVPPVELDPLPTPVKPVREYDMMQTTQANFWAAQAAIWLETAVHKKSCEVAEKEIRAMVPADAMRVWGASLEVTRDKAGRLHIKGRI